MSFDCSSGLEDHVAALETEKPYRFLIRSGSGWWGHFAGWRAVKPRHRSALICRLAADIQPWRYESARLGVQHIFQHGIGLPKDPRRIRMVNHLLGYGRSASFRSRTCTLIVSITEKKTSQIRQLAEGIDTIVFGVQSSS